MLLSVLVGDKTLSISGLCSEIIAHRTKEKTDCSTSVTTSVGSRDSKDEPHGGSADATEAVQRQKEAEGKDLIARLGFKEFVSVKPRANLYFTRTGS